MRGRKNRGPRYYESRNAWYAYIDKRRHLLAKGNTKASRLEAFRRYHELGANATQPIVQTGTVTEVCARYLRKLEVKNAPPNTLEIRNRYLGQFVTACGGRAANSLTVDDVIEWLGGYPRWAQNTQRTAITSIKAAWNHAKLTNLKDLERPASEARDEDCLITPEQHSLLLAAALPALRDVLIALEATGHRPGAITSVEARECHGDVWRLPPKPGRKVKKKFFVLLTPPLVELTARLCAAHPKGPIFRDSLGQPWNEDSLQKAFNALRLRVGLPKGIVCYSYRHTFATRAALAGMTPFALAKLLATSPTMLEKYYARANEEHVRAEFKKLCG